MARNKNNASTMLYEQVLAKNIRTIREYFEMSRPDFAKLIEVPPTTLKNYELLYRTHVPVTLLRNIATHPQMGEKLAAKLLKPILLTKADVHALIKQ